MKLTDFIGVYDNILAPNICDSLISTISCNKYTKFNQTSGDYNKDVEIRSGSEMLLTHKDHENLKNELISSTFEAIDLYLNQTSSSSRFVSHNADVCKFENYRIRTYNKGEGFFKEHCDIIGTETMSRLFVIMFYLNTVESGGETEFTNLDLAIKPKKGSVLIFHPNFMFPHQANIPISSNKYTAQTYIHYS